MVNRSKEALKAVVAARVSLMMRAPFYGTLALALKLVESPSAEFCETMAVDGINMWHWPEFVLSLTQPHLTGVVAHEVSHCSYKHMTRMGHRDPLMWNIAGDYRINFDLKEAHPPFELPGVPLAWSVDDDKPGVKGHLYDVRFKGMTTEAIYEVIKRDCDAAGGGVPDDITEASMTGRVMQAPAGSSADREQLERKWNKMARIALNAQRARGPLPGYLVAFAAELDKPELNWLSILQTFVDQFSRRDRSWARPNRRLISKGWIMPGDYSDGVSHLVAFIDTSGSMSDKLVAKILSEAAGAMDTGTIDKLTIAYADADVGTVEEFTAGDIVTPAKRIPRGGTSFDASFKWLARHAPNASGVVYLTDMCTCSWGKAPDCPVLWITQLGTQYEKPPFGTVIEAALQ